MESQLPRTQGHHYESEELSHNPTGMHSGVGGEDEGHHEKHSVLKKVKEKAKKIKNTLKKHGHGHEHGHSHDEYEEDDEDEEMEQDPEIHGAPIYESAAVRSAAREPGTGLAHYAPGPNLEKPSVMAEDRYDSVYSPPVKTFGQWEKEEEEGKHTGYLGGFGAKGVNPLPEHKQVPVTSVQGHSPGLEFSRIPTDMEGSGGGIGRSSGFEEDPHSPYVRDVSSNVQAKTIDPAGKGSEEAAGITPLLQKMRITDTQEQKPKTDQGEKQYTGSRNQFAPEPHDTLNPSNQNSTFAPSPLGHKNPDSIPKSYDATNPETMPHDTFNPSNQSSTYTEKIMSASAAAASAIADTTKSAKNVISSKMGQMREQGDDGKTTQQGSVTGTASDYAHKVAATVTETLAPVYGKVVGAGSAVSSKVTGMGGQQGQERTENVGQDKVISATVYNWAEKLKPGEEDKALSEMITETLSKKPKPKTENTEEEVAVGEGRGISGIVSDAIHKRKPEESGEERPMGKVTESAEVAERLGTGGEEKKLENLGVGGGGGGGGVGVVDRIKGVVGSWLSGQGGDTQINPGTTFAGEQEKDDDNQGVAGERRLQESGN